MSTSRCPQCAAPLSRAEIQRCGLLHARAMNAGGPFYTFACPTCGMRMIAEVDSAGSIRLSGKDDLRTRPRLRTILDFFLGPPKTTLKGAKSSSRPKPASTRKSDSTRPRAQPRTPSSGSTAAGRLLSPSERDFAARLSLAHCTTCEEVRREYRRFVRENHPDRFANRSLNEREAADHAFRKRHQEYQALLKRIDARERGMRRD